MRRMLVTVAMAIVAAPALAPPASAHSVAGVSSTNYRTTLHALTPEVDGVTVKVVEAGSRFELTNRTRTEVVVLGYQDEPFLRVGLAGVFENKRSPSTYLSRSRNGGAAPEFTDASAPPEWKRTSTGSTARWHDHRIHWMGAQDPPQVRRAPSRTHIVIPKWEIPLELGSQLLVATGDLAWVPGPSPLPWLLAALGLASLGFAAGLGRRRWQLLAGLLAIAIVADVTHAVGVAFAGGGSTGARLGRVLTGSTFSAVAWAVGALGVVLLLRRKIDGVFAAAFAGLVIALLGGLVDIGKLSRSQVAFQWSTDIARGCVAVSLGLGVGVALAAGLTIRDESRAHAATTPIRPPDS